MQKINHEFSFNISRLVKSLRRFIRLGQSNEATEGVYPLNYPVLALTMTLTACNTAPVADVSDDVIDNRPEAEVAENQTPVNFEPMIQAIAETDEPVAKAIRQPVNLDGDSLFNLLAAEFAGNSGDIDASLQYYRQASETIEDSRIAARTAYIALYGEEYEEALVALDRWQELEPDSTELPRMYAATYLKLGQPEKAVPYIKTTLSSSRGEPTDKAMAVKQMLAKEATVADAYIVLSELNREEKNKHLMVLQSRYAAQLKKYDESLALLDEVLVIDPSLHEVLIIKARILSTQGKHDEAAVLIKQVLEELPDNNALRLQYARMLVEQRDLPAAIVQYSILSEKLPDDGEIILSLALLNIETKNLDEAIEALLHLIDIDKKVSIANYYLGRISQNQGDEKQAIAYYLRVNGGDYRFDSQLRIGVLLSILGKPDEGLAKLEALAEKQTSWTLRVKVYLAQGEVLRKQHRYKEGVEMYSRALQQNHEDTTLLYARGLMAEKVDRLDMAEADLLKVISKEPDNADALNALGYTLADRTARYKEALKYIERAAELVPDDPAILDSLGWVSYRLGKMDDAIKWLSKAFEKLEDAEIAAHYGEVLWHSDKKDEARKIWNKGKKQNADNPVLVETLDRIKP